MDQKDSNQQGQVAAHTEDGQFHQPSADFLKLIRILWDGKWFLIIFCAVFTLIFTLLPIYLIEPVYKTSATYSISSLSIPQITGYLDSDAFRAKLLNRTENKNDNQVPFSYFARALYSTPEKKVGSLDIFWESNNPENALSNLNIASDLIEKFMSNELKTPQQVKIELIRNDMLSMKPLIEKQYQQGDQNFSLALLDLVVEYAIKKDHINQLKFEDVLKREFIAVKQPRLPAKPYKPNKLQIFSAAFLTSIGLAIFVLLGRFMLKKRR